MEYVVKVFEVIIFFIITLALFKTVKKLGRSNKTVNLILVIFYIFFVLPIGIDVFITYPSYNTWYVFRNFDKSYSNLLVRVIYDIWVLVAYIIIYVVGNKSKNKYKIINNNIGIKNKYLVTIFFIISIIPVLFVIIFKLPIEIIYTPFWLDRELYNFSGTRLETVYYALQRFTFISIPAGFLYIMNINKEDLIKKIIMCINIYFLICIESKRAIIAIILIMIVSHLIYNVEFKKRKYVIICGIIILIVLLAFSIIYMGKHRSYNVEYNIVNTYTQVKMDFMRDDRMKYVIYSLLNPNIRILQYPFQSYITQIPSLFPLEYIIPMEVVGYNKFFTCSLLELPISSGANWVTTSFFDEMIANFSVFGFFIGPWIIGKICAITDRYSTRLKVISIVGITLLFMLSLNYIAWYLQFWVFVLIIEKYKIKNRRVY